MKTSAKIASVAAAAFGISFAKYVKMSKEAYGGNVKDPDYLMILGCTVEGDQPCEMLKLRMKAAADFLKENPNTIAVPCGGIVHDGQTVSEADTIAKYLVESGIDENRIIIENQSQTTYENFINAKKLISERCDIDKAEIAFLSSNFHILRSSYIAKQTGLKASGVPAPSPKGLYAPALLREYLVFPMLLHEIKQKSKEN